MVVVVSMEKIETSKGDAMVDEMTRRKLRLGDSIRHA